jgi:very-short-patch-repair endonuclease
LASHLTAAALHAYPDAVEEGIEVTVPTRTQPRIAGVRVHRPATVANYEHRSVRGIPVTSYARTLVDCSGWMSLGQLARALDAGLVQRKTTLWSVERSLAPLRAAPGRHPSKLRLLLEERGTGELRSESRPEIRLLRLIVGAGLPEPVQQHRVTVDGERFRLDFAYPARMVAIEYDGWDTHRSRSAFDRDRRRDRKLQLAGWTVLRITSQTSDAELLDTSVRLCGKVRDPDRIARTRARWSGGRGRGSRQSGWGSRGG